MGNEEVQNEKSPNVSPKSGYPALSTASKEKSFPRRVVLPFVVGLLCVWALCDDAALYTVDLNVGVFYTRPRLY